jgi:GR25 family glycosyltransferase involved in LPS biosynthesis
MELGVDKIYVITLDRLKVRKKHILDLEKQLNCEFNLIDGVDYVDHINDHEFIKKHLADKFFDPSGLFSIGILCCALSHRKAWGEFLNSGEELGLFLEDDIEVTPYINKYDFKQIRHELSTLNWGVCWFGKYKDIIFTEYSLTNNISKILPHYQPQYAGHSYVLNRKSAEWFYNKTEKISHAVDVQLEISPFLQVSLTNSVFNQKKNGYLKSNVPVDKEFLKSNTLGEGYLDKELNEIILPKFHFLEKSPKSIVVNNRLIEGWEFSKKLH